MKIVCTSDTNNNMVGLEDLSGDILIHCGDFTNSGTQKQVYQFLGWLEKLNFKHKIIIAGHKQYSFDVDMYESKLKKIFHNGFPDYDGDTYKNQLLSMENVYYLEHEYVEIEGIKIFGSPYQPLYQDLAFGRQDQQLCQKWEEVKDQIDILVTHCAPFGIMDQYKKTKTGCKFILEKVKQLKPKYHIFGHCRQCYGMQKVDETTFINCSRFDSKFKPTNPPVTINYE